MKTIINYIKESQNFLIKGHTKNQSVYDVYQYIKQGTPDTHKFHYVALTKINQIKDFFEYCKTHNIKEYTNYNAEKLLIINGLLFGLQKMEILK